MLNDDQRRVFAAVAETLIPASDTMPSATAADVAGTSIDEVLGYRPDLVDAFISALADCANLDPTSALDVLVAEHPDRFEALSALTAGAYLITPAVKAAMPYDAAPRPVRDDTDDYLDLLEHVVDRGFVIR